MIGVSFLWSPTEHQRSCGYRAAHEFAGWKQRRGADFLRVLAADWKTGEQTGRLHSVNPATVLSIVALNKLCNTNQLSSSCPTVNSKACKFFYHSTYATCVTLWIKDFIVLNPQPPTLCFLSFIHHIIWCPCTHIWAGVYYSLDLGACNPICVTAATNTPSRPYLVP